MKLYKYPVKEIWNEIIQRPDANDNLLEKKVRKILQKVKANGDKAVIKYSKEFDGVSIKKLRVTEKEIEKAGDSLTTELKAAILQAKRNIEAFHLAQKEQVTKIEIMPGISCWRKPLPIEKIGLYIPGGTAPLFSTVLMLAIPAIIAGCKEIILCTPPSKEKTIHPTILYTASLCGITKIYKAGGVQAIAAMAFGTGTIPKVFKIFGPGNRYVTLAKKLVQQENVSIDLPAGPSELLIIADETAEPAFIAADLLSQAEHGKDSQVILLTTDETIADKVAMEIKSQLELIPRNKIAQHSLLNSKIVILQSIHEAVDLSNLYAPEHLIICSEDAEGVAEQITAAGAVFIGNYSPESAGDYATGTNHTLPTNGYAAMYSGVSVDSFVKKISFQQLTRQGLRDIGNTVMEMAAAEGLDAHKNAVAIRLKN